MPPDYLIRKQPKSIICTQEQYNNQPQIIMQQLNLTQYKDNTLSEKDFNFKCVKEKLRRMNELTEGSGGDSENDFWTLIRAFWKWIIDICF